MPTGYTASVADGEVMDFETFALQCARAFGATVTMRDEPLSTPIPNTFRADTYYSNARKEAQQEMRRIASLSMIEVQREMQQEHSMAMDSWRRRSWTDAAKRVRYLAMIDKVNAWTPPSADHVELKEFMLDQLKESMKFDCGGEHNIMPKIGRWDQWRGCIMYNLDERVRRYGREQRSEDIRVDLRNDWVRKLRESLVKDSSI